MDSHPDSRLKTLVNTNTLCRGGGGREEKRGWEREGGGRKRGGGRETEM